MPLQVILDNPKLVDSDKNQLEKYLDRWQVAMNTSVGDINEIDVDEETSKVQELMGDDYPEAKN